MIRLEALSVGYRTPLVAGIDVRFERGELIGLVGRNGTGKSTLLRTLAGLQKPLGGTIRIAGEPLGAIDARRLARLIGFVTTQRIEVEHLSARALVGLGRAPYTGWLGKLSDDDRAAVERALRSVGMEALADHPIRTLSDGERQRVMIARALAQHTPIILLDEPTAFLDLPNRYQICALLRTLSHELGTTILFSTHDLSLALELCDRMAILADERLTIAAPEELRFDTDTLSICLR